MSYITIYILYVLYNYIYTLHYYTQYTIRMREEPPPPPLFSLSRLLRCHAHTKTHHDTHPLASRHEALCLVSLQPSPHEAPSIPLRGKSGERLTRKGERGTLFPAISHIVSRICYICNE